MVDRVSEVSVTQVQVADGGGNVGVAEEALHDVDVDAAA